MKTSADPSTEAVNEIRDNDVLLGRGGHVNAHPGNIVFRRVVSYNGPRYQEMSCKRRKKLLLESIVLAIKRNGGRFLQKTDADGWSIASAEKVRLKTGQALREVESVSGAAGALDPFKQVTTVTYNPLVKWPSTFNSTEAARGKKSAVVDNATAWSRKSLKIEASCFLEKRSPNLNSPFFSYEGHPELDCQRSVSCKPNNVQVPPRDTTIAPSIESPMVHNFKNPEILMALEPTPLSTDGNQYNELFTQEAESFPKELLEKLLSPEFVLDDDNGASGNQEFDSFAESECSPYPLR